MKNQSLKLTQAPPVKNYYGFSCQPGELFLLENGGKMAEWLKGCEVCDEGLCAKFTKLLDSGDSYRKAGKELEKEQKKELGVVIHSSSKLIKRFQRNTPVKTVDSCPQSFDTCAISDLQKLIDNGKQFSTIYADPPWKYSNQATRSATDNHYDTMTVKDIANLPVPELTTDNAHLHLWTTNAFLPESFKIIEAWGFEYKSIFVWVKPQMGIGNYWRVSHEFMLFGLKGKQPFLNRGQMSWQKINRTKHSKKPEEIAQTIEKTSPGPYLELFGRQTRPGWTVWGNEIERTLFNKAAFNDKKTEV